MPAPNNDIRISQHLQACEQLTARAVELVSHDDKTPEAFTEAAGLYNQVNQRLDAIKREIVKCGFHPGVARFLSKQVHALIGDNQRVVHLVEQAFSERARLPIEKQIIALLDEHPHPLTVGEIATLLTSRVQRVEHAHDAFMHVTQRGRWQPLYQRVTFTQDDVEVGLRKCIESSSSRLVRTGWLPANRRWTTHRNRARVGAPSPLTAASV